MHIEWTMRKTGTILGSEIRGMRRRTRDDRVKQRISGKEMEKEKKKEKRRTDSKKETIKYEERERERGGGRPSFHQCRCSTTLSMQTVAMQRRC